MPHKRAKKSARDADRLEKGYDNAPTTSDVAPKNSVDNPPDVLSKNLYRILNAEKIRKERAERIKSRENAAAATGNGAAAGNSKKRKAQDDQASSLTIQPGENLKAFNNRVEMALRPEISSAIKHSKTASKKAKLARSTRPSKGNTSDGDEQEHDPTRRPPPRRQDQGKERASDFASREKLRLNDIALEPPSFSKNKSNTGGGQKQGGLLEKKTIKKKELPVSMKQKDEMEAARTLAIERYRQLKAQQLAANQ